MAAQTGSELQTDKRCHSQIKKLNSSIEDSTYILTVPALDSSALYIY